MVEFKSCFGELTRQDYAVWEWFPEKWAKIDNFPISPNESVHCFILAGKSGETGWVYMTRHPGPGPDPTFSYTVHAPRGQRLVGNSAEWIVEPPKANGNETPDKVLNFRREKFIQCNAKGLENLFIDGFDIRTQDSANQLIARGEWHTGNTVSCTYVYPC